MSAVTNDQLAAQELFATRATTRASAILTKDRESSIFRVTVSGVLVAEFQTSRMSRADSQRVLDGMVSTASEAMRIAREEPR